MITESTIYWVTRLDSFKAVAAALGFASCAFFAILALVYALVRSDDGEDWNNIKYFFWRLVTCAICGLVLGISSCFIPTTKEICAIKVIPMVAQNKDMQEIPGKAAELANEWIAELRPRNMRFERERP